MSLPAERLRLALEMFDVGVEMYRVKLRRTRPDLSSDQIRVLVQAWLLDRPGDTVGQVVPFPAQ